MARFWTGRGPALHVIEKDWKEMLVEEFEQEYVPLRDKVRDLREYL